MLKMMFKVINVVIHTMMTISTSTMTVIITLQESDDSTVRFGVLDISADSIWILIGGIGLSIILPGMLVGILVGVGM